MRDPALRMNWSSLKHIAISPALFKWRVEQPQEDTAALKFGRALHCLILEPTQFDRRWVVAAPCTAIKKSGEICGSTGSLYMAGAWFCKVRGHAPDGAGDPPEGIESITPDQREIARFCAARIAAHAVASETLSDGRTEEALEWTDQFTGIACKGRLDFLRHRVVDLKTSCMETSREFLNDAASRLYHGQIAWYHDGAIAAGRLPDDAPRPRIVAVSNVEPYDVAVYEFDETSLEAGRIVYRDLLRRYIECDAADWWPGHSPDLLPFELPPWAEGMRAAEERIG